MYYEDAKENAAFERCTDVITNMIIKYGPLLKRYGRYVENMKKWKFGLEKKYCMTISD